MNATVRTSDGKYPAREADGVFRLAIQLKHINRRVENKLTHEPQIFPPLKETLAQVVRRRV